MALTRPIDASVPSSLFGHSYSPFETTSLRNLRRSLYWRSERSSKVRRRLPTGHRSRPIHWGARPPQVVKPQGAAGCSQRIGSVREDYAASGPSPASRALFRFASLRATSDVVHFKNRLRKVQGASFASLQERRRKVGRERLADGLLHAAKIFGSVTGKEPAGRSSPRRSSPSPALRFAISRQLYSQWARRGRSGPLLAPCRSPASFPRSENLWNVGWMPDSACDGRHPVRRPFRAPRCDSGGSQSARLSQGSHDKRGSYLPVGHLSSKTPSPLRHRRQVGFSPPSTGFIPPAGIMLGYPRAEVLAAMSSHLSYIRSSAPASCGALNHVMSTKALAPAAVTRPSAR